MLAQAACRGTPPTETVVLVRAGAPTAAAAFARASVATCISGDGLVTTVAAGASRLDHNPLNGEPLGLLIEPAATNRLLWSMALETSPWTASGATVSRATQMAPDGATDVSLLTESDASEIHTLYQAGVTFDAGVAHTLSVFARSNGRERLQLVLPSTAFGTVCSAVFDLTTTTVVATEGTVITDMVSLPDDWIRCAVTATADAGGTAAAYLRMRSTSGSSAYAGDGGSGVFLWGAQVEAAARVSSPILTEDATASRVADTLSADVSGTQNLHLIGSAADGTAYTAAVPFIQTGQTGTWSAPAGTWSAIHARTPA